MRGSCGAERRRQLTDDCCEDVSWVAHHRSLNILLANDHPPSDANATQYATSTIGHIHDHSVDTCPGPLASSRNVSTAWYIGSDRAM